MPSLTPQQLSHFHTEGQAHTLSGLPVYVHLKGLANVSLKYPINARILSRRPLTDVKFQRLITRRTSMLNQISI